MYHTLSPTQPKIEQRELFSLPFPHATPKKRERVGLLSTELLGSPLVDLGVVEQRLGCEERKRSEKRSAREFGRTERDEIRRERWVNEPGFRT